MSAAMNDPLDLCIVIPTFNRKEQLCILLGQLKQQQVKDISYKIVVVVDGSTDGTLELLQTEFPEVHVVRGNGSWWFTRSLNEGCKYAVNVLNARLILTSNDDVQLPDTYLQELLRNYEECGENSVIGSSSYSMTEPRMITFSGLNKRNLWLLKDYNYIAPYTLLEPGALKGVAPSVTLSTRGLLMPAKIMKAISYLDEKFPQYASDYDLVFRAAEAGAKIYVSYDAYIFENMQLTSNGNPRLTKSFKAYMHNVFFNKYSSHYFFNATGMAWRHGWKLLFPYYIGLILVSVFYIYIKYKFFINKKLQEQL